MGVTAKEISAVLAAAELLYDQAQIQLALDDMARRIARDLKGRNPIVLCVMNGGIVVTGHLLMRLDFPLQLDYVHATRYRGQTRGGELRWQKKSTLALEDRVVLIVDDILDEGYTLAGILDCCRAQGVQQVTTAVLVNKHHVRKQPGAHAEYVGLTVDDRYVFGFGMDYKGYLRNLPAIYAVKAA